jgi:hypothetical protein
MEQVECLVWNILGDPSNMVSTLHGNGGLVGATLSYSETPIVFITSRRLGDGVRC